MACSIIPNGDDLVKSQSDAVPGTGNKASSLRPRRLRIKLGGKIISPHDVYAEEPEKVPDVQNPTAVDGAVPAVNADDVAVRTSPEGNTDNVSGGAVPEGNSDNVAGGAVLAGSSDEAAGVVSEGNSEGVSEVRRSKRKKPSPKKKYNEEDGEWFKKEKIYKTKRSMYSLALTKKEIEEDLAKIAKLRRRSTLPVTSPVKLRSC